MYCIVNCIYLFVFPIVADMESIVCFTRPRLLNTNIKLNKTKVVRADLHSTGKVLKKAYFFNFSYISAFPTFFYLSYFSYFFTFPHFPIFPRFPTFSYFLYFFIFSYFFLIFMLFLLFLLFPLFRIF